MLFKSSKLEEINSAIVEYAINDKSFRERLLSFPEQALKSIGITLPYKKVSVIEQTEDECVLIIPCNNKEFEMNVPIYNEPPFTIRGLGTPCGGE